MSSKPPPPRGDVDPEVSFSWPGQRRRPDQGVLEARVAQRRRRQQQTDADEAGAPAPPAPPAPPPPASDAPGRERAQAPAPPGPPARRDDTTASGARDRWIVTELRRQAVSTESSLRDVNERLDQLSRTLRQ